MGAYPVSIPRYISTKQAIRTALGKIGYATEMQRLEPDLIDWSIEASDYISRPRTLIAYDDDFVIENNRIPIRREWQMIDCISIQGVPLLFKFTKGCSDSILTKESKCRCCKGVQAFTFDNNSCFIHFTPAIKDGICAHIEWIQRPIGEDGYPLVLDVCSPAISEYVASMVCLRFRDNRYEIWNQKWLNHCRWARTELNRIQQQQLEGIGEVYHFYQGQWNAAPYNYYF